MSANPTGLLHVGTARGAAIGDSICRILSFAGYDVTREYYINDAGNQIDHLAESILARYKQLFGLKAELPEDGYHGEDIIFVANKIAEEVGDKLDAADKSEVEADLKALKDLVDAHQQADEMSESDVAAMKAAFANGYSVSDNDLADKLVESFAI